jgi:predicted metalloprotease with PDZ domain
VPGNAVIAEDSPLGPQIRKLLAHECFHEFNGQRIRLVYPGDEHTWFSEGFTEYFARRLLYEDELLEESRYLKWINESLLEYHRSSARNLPADELGKIFWTSREGQQQPYLRGELVAMLAEHAIRMHTNSEKTLRDFMQALLHETVANPDVRFDTEGLLERLAAFTGPELIPTLRSICVDGATVQLPADVLGDSFVLSETITHEYEAGFDTDASIPALRISGLVAGSTADQAGLRDGDEIVGRSIEHGRSELPVTLTVRSNAQETPRKLSYYPRGAEIRVQQIRKSED